MPLYAYPVGGTYSFTFLLFLDAVPQHSAMPHSQCAADREAAPTTTTMFKLLNHGPFVQPQSMGARPAWECAR